MKTFIAATLVGFTSLCSASDSITDFTVFSKTNIEYARSDFEGLVGAGGNIVVEDFSFVRATLNGVIAGETLKQSRGYIGSTPIRTGKTIQLNNLQASGDLSSAEVYLDNSTIRGDVRANYMKVTSGYMGYPTSSFGKWKKIGRAVAEREAMSLQNDLISLGIDLDSLSKACEALPGETVVVENGKLILNGSKDQNVFNVDGQYMAMVNEIIFRVPPQSTSIINVSGSSVVFEQLGVKLNAADPKKIIWNIFEATSLRIRNAGGRDIVNGRAVGMPGTFMAPMASTTFNEALITGSLWVEKLDGNEPGLNGGQVNDSLFNGISCSNTGKPGGKK